jgi:peptidoglycan/xylan/chitin deacetylase (PgdA/CDA1 family)
MRVLAYHSIDPDGSLLSVHPNTFRSHLAWLRDNGYETLPSIDVAPPVKEDWGHKKVAITFDDGFQELHRYAFPLLREFSYTATIFVTVGCVGRTAAWMERDWCTITRRITPRLRLGPDDSERHVRQLRRCSGRRLLSCAEIAEMHAYGIDFQSHSWSHPFFSNLTPQAARWELAESKAQLEQRLGKPVGCFAYPYGDHGLPGLKNIIRETGYRAAFCDDWAPARDKDADPYEMNRIPVGNEADPAYLRLCFSAGFPWYRSLAAVGKHFI